MSGLRAGNVLLVLGLALAAISAATVPAEAQDAPTATATAEPSTASSPSPGTYGPPNWLPLRADLDGGPITVGCTYDSHGSDHGYECGGHHGRWAIDFLASAGTPVYAAGAGFATDLTGRPGGSGFGLVVRVDHGNGDITLYAHLTTVAIPPAGTWVDRNTLLGTVGSTGSSSANHLHYERRNVEQNVAVDPGELLACQDGRLVRYPEAGGTDTWKHLVWGAFSVQSDGTDCATPSGLQQPAPATPIASRVRASLDPPRSGPWARLFRAGRVGRAIHPSDPVDPVDQALDRLLTRPS